MGVQGAKDGPCQTFLVVILKTPSNLDPPFPWNSETDPVLPEVVTVLCRTEERTTGTDDSHTPEVGQPVPREVP